MGKKKNFNSGLGRALMNSKTKKDIQKNIYYEKYGAEMVEVNPKQKLESKTERPAMEEFLYEAELMQKRFEGVKDKTLIVKDAQVIIRNKDNIEKRRENKEKIVQKVNYLRIPRRPDWKGKTVEQQKMDENISFVDWRRELAKLEDTYSDIILTPFEKNLDVWKQLWYVVERSDVVVQIVDCRDPYFYWCEDLQNYVKETDEKKINFLVLNKADLIPERVRELVSADLNKKNIQHVFFSAKEQQELIDNEEQQEITDNEKEPVELDLTLNTPRILDRLELMSMFTQFEKKETNDKLIVGMVGYPNVGKSSLINTLCAKKKVGVDHKPGKTKNMQTIILSDKLMLCDCPGLVMPSIVASKAEMVCNGVLPIHSLIGHIDPVLYMLEIVPIELIRRIYRLPVIHIKDNAEVIDARDLLQIYSATRGYHTGSGIPNEARAAKIILSDYVTGKIPHFELSKEYKEETKAIYQSIMDEYGDEVDVMPFKNTKKEDLISEAKLNMMDGIDKDMVEAEKQKTEEEQFIDDINEQDIFDLLEGKKVMGKKLTKGQRRELKFAVKGKTDMYSILLLVHSFIFNKHQSASLKRTIMNKVF